MFPRNVHSSAQHERRERDARNPTDKADSRKHSEQQEHDTTAILLLHDIVNPGRQGEHNVQNARYPDEELRESPRTHKVGPGESQRDTEHKHE